MKAKATSLKTKLNRIELIKDPIFTGRIIAFILVSGMMLGNVPVLAQGGDIGAVITGLVESITEIIRSAAVGLGVLGLVMWGVAKLVRPYMPSMSQTVNDYIPELIKALVVIAFANELVSGITSAIGSGGGGS